MKKLLFVLAIGAFAACNDSSTESESTSDTSASITPDTTTIAPMDTTTTVPVDTTTVKTDSAATK